MIELEFLKEQNVSESLIHGIEEFRRNYNVDEGAAARVTRPSIPFYGKEILEMAIAGLLEGENLLLAGPKATGKNILAENLAYAFGRPVYNVSFHVNTNSGDLIGTDTFVNNEVCLRKGSINSVPSMVASVFWMRSIWQRTMRSLSFMQLWTIAAPLMFRAMTGSTFILRHVLSEP